RQMSAVFDLIRFHAFAGYYEAAVRGRPTADPRDAAFFDWGETSFLGSLTLYTLIYDESGDIALKARERNNFFYKKTMPARYGIINDESCKTSGFPIKGHFYSVTITC